MLNFRYSLFFFGSGGINDSGDLTNAIGWESSSLGMFQKHLLVRCVVNAENLVCSNKTFDPINLRAHF